MIPTRINVVGTSGSGKTTLARQIAERLALPSIELDACYWQSGWVPSDEAQFLDRIGRICNDEAWVLDGNYSITTALKWRRCQLVVWLDRSFPRTLYQVLTRTLRRTITAEELWPGTGNVETLSRSLFAADGVVWWSIKTWRRNRLRYTAAMTDPSYEHIRFVRLRSDKDIRQFLTALDACASQGDER